MPNVTQALLLGSVLAFVYAMELVAQEDTVISETCGEPLRIEAVRELHFGGPDDPGRIMENSRNAADSRRRVIFWPYGSEAHVYDSTGSFVTSFGREGQGPGEYATTRIQALWFDPGDSLHVFDAGNMRHTHLSPDLQVVETNPLPVRPVLGGVVRLASGKWVFNAHIPTPARIGWPLHLVNEEWEIERSFGSLAPAYRGDVSMSGERVLTPAGEDRVWAGWKTEYRLELWDTENRKVRSLVRDVPWFRPWVRQNMPIRPDAPWNPYVLAIRLDRTGTLWVVVLTASDNWGDHVVELAPGQYAIEEPAYRAFQSVVEAIDVERACVLARLEPDGFTLRPISEGRFVSYFEGPDGVPYRDVWGLRLVDSTEREEE